MSSRRRLRTKTNAFIVSLAVADFCVGMSVVPSLFFCDITNTCYWPQAWLSWVNFLRWLFSYVSVTTLCCLVLDRYTAVVKPLKYLTFMTRRRVIATISLTWGTTVVFVLLQFSLRVTLKTPLVTTVFLWLDIIFLEFLLGVILIFCFASMLHFVYKHNRSTRNLAKQLRFNHCVLYKTHHEKSAVIMMAIVIGLFLVCYAMYLRCSFVVMLNVQTSCNDFKYKTPLLVLNSAVNPLTYAFFKRDIKTELKKLLCIGMLKKSGKVKPFVV